MAPSKPGALRVVSLFAGCGGADMGLHAAARDLGIEVEVVAAYDSWEPAVRVYNANLHPVAQVCDLKSLASIPDCDLVIGGPPCQPFSMAGKRTGHSDERNRLPDFIRLARVNEPGGPAYIMENVVSRLINAPWSERLCAADFGDVTSRKRWFYSNYLLHVIPTPGPRRIRDIRDHAEDERVRNKRMPKHNGCKAGNHTHYESDESLGSLTAHAWHGHDIRNGKLVAITGQLHPSQDDEVMGTVTASPHGGVGGFLKLGLRGNSASASAFEDDETLGSVLSNSWHGNEASRIVGCRNPSLLEMQRAHSFPETWDWAGCTKAQRGQQIANSWPIGMATAVCKAMLLSLGREKGAA